jgi:SPP1 gp7 family putative phage head morphogenesis protein
MKKQSPPLEFKASKTLQRAYEDGIRQITGRVLLKKLPEQSSSEWLASLAARSKEPDVLGASELLAKRMVGWTYKRNYATWREAARRSTQSRQLYEALQDELQGATGARVAQLVRENAALISSVSLTAAQALTDEVTKAQQSGARAGTISKMMQRRFPELLKSRVNLIARTETAKASTALTQARCERLNIDWIQWETSHDQRTRASHKAMNGVLAAWSDPPSPEALIGEKDYGKYMPGETFNCRCLVIPILSLDDITFPARVYHRGAIRTMTKQQFKKIAVGLEAAA